MVKAGYNFTFYENKEPDTTFKEYVEFTKFEGFEILGCGGDKKYDVNIPCGDTAMVILKAKVSESGA